MSASPSWTIDEIEDAIKNNNGDLGIRDGIQFHVTRDGDGYRGHVSVPGSKPSAVNVTGWIKLAVDEQSGSVKREP